MDVQSLLRRTPALEGADASSASRLAGSASIRTFERGDALWRAGDRPGTFVVIAAGLVKIVRGSAGGKRTICGLFAPPDSVGDVVLLRGAPYPADAVVASNTASVVSVPRDVLLACVEQCPTLGLSIARSAHAKVEVLHGAIEALSAGGVEARLATAMLKLCDTLGQAGADGTFVIPIALTRRELADFVSTSMETAIRLMARWQRERVVATRRGAFLVLDRDRLVQLARRQPTP